MTRFATDTAVFPLGEGRYAATIDRGWWIERGPNGGYLAAIVLRAMLAEVADAERRPRSLTLHYLRPPVEGPGAVVVTVERAGRGLTTVSARLVQDERDCILALAALGVDRSGPEIHDHPAPRIAGPDDLPPRPAPAAAPDIPFRHRFDLRFGIGSPPFAAGYLEETGELWSADGRLLAESRQLAVVTRH